MVCANLRESRGVFFAKVRVSSENICSRSEREKRSFFLGLICILRLSHIFHIKFISKHTAVMIPNMNGFVYRLLKYLTMLSTFQMPLVLRLTNTRKA